MENTINPWAHPRVSQINENKLIFPFEPKLAKRKIWLYVATCVIHHEQYVGKTSNKVSVW